MTKFFYKFKKPCFLARFWSIFRIFGKKTFFSRKSGSARLTSNGFLAPCQNLEKTNDTIPKKTPGQTEGQTDPIL